MRYAEVCLREWDDLRPEKGSHLFQRFMDDPPLVNASVATSALKVNVSALLAF